MKTLKNFDLRSFIEEIMKKKDRYVNLYFTDDGVNVSIYPIKEESENG